MNRLKQYKNSSASMKNSIVYSHVVENSNRNKSK